MTEVANLTAFRKKKKKKETNPINAAPTHHSGRVVSCENKKGDLYMVARAMLLSMIIRKQEKHTHGSERATKMERMGRVYQGNLGTTPLPNSPAQPSHIQP